MSQTFQKILIFFLNIKIYISVAYPENKQILKVT